MSDQALATRLDFITNGTQEAVVQMNRVAQASVGVGKNASDSAIGYTQLEHVMFRVAGGNRELYMLFRGVAQASQDASNGIGTLARNLQSTLIIGGLVAGAVGSFRWLQSTIEDVKKSMTDLGYEEQSTFRILANSFEHLFGFEGVEAKIIGRNKELDASRAFAAKEIIERLPGHEMSPQRNLELAQGRYKARTGQEMPIALLQANAALFASQEMGKKFWEGVETSAKEGHLSGADTRLQDRLLGTRALGTFNESGLTDPQIKALLQGQIRKEDLISETADKERMDITKGARRYEGGLSETGSLESYRALNYTRLGRESSDIPAKQLEEMKRLGITMKDILGALKTVPTVKLN